MTERQAHETFETRFAERALAYTDPRHRAPRGRARHVACCDDVLAGDRRVAAWARQVADRSAHRRWSLVGALVAVVLIGVIAVAIVGRPSDSAIGPQPTGAIASIPAASGPIPDALRHSWQRPYAVTPGLDQWGSGSLTLAGGIIDVAPEPGAAASRSAIGSAAPDTLVVTATAETRGCAIGDAGTYHWSVEGQGTVMTLMPIGADACTTRERALAGQWVRSDLPLPPSGITLAPGTYPTAAFDPFGAPGVSEQLSYTVPERWKVKEDQAETFLLHQLPDDLGSQPSADLFLHLFTQPRMAADFAAGAICGSSTLAPDVGRGVDEIVAAIRARPGVVSTSPSAVTIGGYRGQMLDLHLAASWTGGCKSPDGPIVAMPILLGSGADVGAGAALGPDSPFRLVRSTSPAGGRWPSLSSVAVPWKPPSSTSTLPRPCPSSRAWSSIHRRHRQWRERRAPRYA